MLPGICTALQDKSASPPALNTAFKPCKASALKADIPAHSTPHPQAQPAGDGAGGGAAPEHVSTVLWVDRLYEVTDMAPEHEERYNAFKSR